MQRTSTGIAQLVRRVCAGNRDEHSDGQLLRRFLTVRDEEAFAALVRRHGSMVFGVCRRALGNVADAEDAFQATFLVLVRKAVSLANRAVLGDWLHGVARRTALKARGTFAARRTKELAMARPESQPEATNDEWLPLLDEELSRLPEKYRLPLVLCDLEGKTRREAAEHLRWPEGTVAGRLARGRTLLAKRLARHGPLLSGGAVALLLAAEASAWVSVSLASGTVRAAGSLAAGQAGVISAKVAALTEGVVTAMFMHKLKQSIGPMLLALFAAAALAYGALAGRSNEPEKPAATVVDKPAVVEDRKRDKPAGPPVFFALRKFDRDRHTILVSLFGTEPTFAELPLAKDVQIWFQGGPAPMLMKGKLADFGLEGAPLTLEFAADGKTVTSVTSYLALTPCILTDLDVRRNTISVVSLGIGATHRDLTLSSEVEVFIDGKRQSFGRLEKGMILNLHPYEPRDPELVRPAPITTTPRFDLKRYQPFAKIEAHTPAVAGVVERVDLERRTLSLTLADPKLRVDDLPVDNNVKISLDGAEGLLKHVKPGFVVTVEFGGDSSAPRERRIVWIRTKGDKKIEGDDAAPDDSTPKKAARAMPPAPVLVVNHRAEAVSVAFSPDGKTLAAGAGRTGIVLWDAVTGKERYRIDGDHVGDSIVFCPDGKVLASTRNWQPGKAGAVVHLWDAATGKPIGKFKGDENLIRCAAFSPDGKLLAAHSQWGTARAGAVRVWEVASGKEVLNIPTNSAGHTIAFSPDGKLLAFDVKYTIRLCSAETGKEVFKLEGHQEVIRDGGVTSGFVNALAFSPDGKRLASASCDNTGRIWDVATGKMLQVLEGHRGFVNAVVFFPDGRNVATGGEDGTIRCWQAATGKQLSQIQAHEMGKRADGDRRKDVFALAFSRDGTRLASGGRDSTVKVWAVETVLEKAGAVSPIDLVRAAIARHGFPPEGYPALPSLSTEMRGEVCGEIAASPAVRSAYEKLSVFTKRNVDWFEGVAELEKQKAVWSLLSCLCHPSEDVQIHALRSLERVKDKRAVPFLMLYAEYMAVHESGSENATIHGIIHQSTAKTLSTITGVEVVIKGQDPERLKQGLKRWRKWLAMQEE